MNKPLKTLSIITAFLMGAATLNGEQGEEEQDLQTAIRHQTVANTLEKICTSPAPVLVFDSFHLSRPDMKGFIQPAPASVDLDNDAISDVAHGDVVAAVLKTSGAHYIPYNQGQDDININTGAALWMNLAQAIQDHKIPRPSYINYSSAFPLSINAVNSLIPDYGLTPENIESRRADVLFTILDHEPANSPLADIGHAFKTLEKLGITVVTSAGNDSSDDTFNFIALFPNVITVGALDDDGKTVAAYTDNSSLVYPYENGTVHITATMSGVDINGDGKTDFPRTIVSSFRTNAKPSESPQSFKDFDGTSVAAPRVCSDRLPVFPPLLASS